MEYASIFEIKPGAAFWVLAREGLNITFNGIPVSLSHNIEVCLSYNPSTLNGWNMIACPNAANYLWEDIEVVHYSSDGSILFGPTPISALPEPNAYVDKRLWRWESGAYNSDTSLIEPYSGYWVKAKQENVGLIFPVSVHASLSNSDIMFAGLLNSAKTWAKKLIFDSQLAIAESDDSPPMPMAGLSGSSADSGGVGGCFIGTAANSLSW
jgi:hypothetical protein